MLLITGVKWVALSQIARALSQLVLIFVLARYLTPYDYGLISIVSVVAAFAMLFRDMGTSSILIQRRRISENFIKSTYTLNFISGLVIFIVMTLLAYPISLFYNDTRLFLLILIISFSFPLQSFIAFNFALLERDQQFNITALIELISLSISIIVVFIVIAMGFGLYAVSLQALLYAIIVVFLLSLKNRRKYKFVWRMKYIKLIFGYCVNVMSFNMVNYFSRNADNIIVGKVFGQYVLGNYALAYRLMLFPVQNITYIFNRALLPKLSHSKDIITKKRIYLDSLKFIAVLSIPAMIGLASLSNELVFFLFGKNWDNAALLLKWLAPVGIIQALTSTTGVVFLSLGNVKLLARIGCVSAIIQVMSFVIGACFNIVIFCQLYLCANVLIFYICFYYVMRLLQGNIKNILCITCKPLFCSVCMLILILVAKNNFITQSNNMELLSLIYYIVIGVGSYVCLMFIIDKNTIVGLLNNALPKRK